MDLTVDKAFEILDTNQHGIPFEAIAYLYEQPSSQEILAKISYSLHHAYDEEAYYDEKTDAILPAPIWYSIVAEGHAHEDLIDGVIALFTTEDDPWDVLNEQGMFLVGLFCEKLGKVAVDKFMKAILTYSKPQDELPIMFMHDAIYFVNQDEYHDQIKAILTFNTPYVEALAITVSSAQYQSLLPTIQSLYDFCKYKERQDELGQNEHILYEVEEALRELKLGKPLYPEQAKPYSQKREPWQEHYQGLIPYFEEEKAE
ncbi:MAG: hypothetical protein GY810_20140 [Aureispira sp.]|nr:hypothetical protein [Aureispira sp.]